MIAIVIPDSQIFRAYNSNPIRFLALLFEKFITIKKIVSLSTRSSATKIAFRHQAGFFLRVTVIIART